MVATMFIFSPHKDTLMQSFDNFFVAGLNKQLNKQSSHQWFMVGDEYLYRKQDSIMVADALVPTGTKQWATAMDYWELLKL